MRVLLLLPALLFACEPSKVQLGGDDTAGTGDNGGDSNGGDSNGGDSNGGDTSDTSDTSDTGETGDPGDVVLTDLSWRLHEEIQSFVYAAWTQSGPGSVHVEYSFDDGEWASSPSINGVTGANEQLIVGIPYATNAAWRVVVDGGPSADGPTITSGPQPNGLPLGEVTVSEPDQWIEGGNYMLTSINERGGGWTGGTYWAFIIDRQGRVIWAKKTGGSHWTLYTQVAVSGDHILVDESTYWSEWDEGRDSVIHSRYLDQEIEVIDTPGLHHEFVQLPDGTLVWGSQYHDGTEALVEMAPGETEQTILWTCDDDWPGSGRDCESNGLWYEESTDTFLYSFYTNNSLVEVDHQSGESLWWAGDVDNGFDFDPPTSQFSWQHGVSFTNEGHLLVSTEWPYNSRDQTTWVAEYEVDRTAGALHYVWGSDSDIYASTNGDALRYDNGNTLHVVGAAGVIREINPAGEDIWRVDFHDDKLLGKGNFIADLYPLLAPR